VDKRTLNKIIKRLNKLYHIEVRKEKPFEVLIHGILSHRTKDETTFPAQERLLKAANAPDKVLKLSAKKIQKLIYPVGFYRQKSKNILRTCKLLVEKFNGKVPKTKEKLMQLPGVGEKTSDIILLFAYGQDIIPVDSHIAAISKRWHIAGKKDKPEVIREKLHKLIPKNRAIINQLLVQFGKDVCKSPIPKCYACPVEKLCPFEDKNL